MGQFCPGRTPSTGSDGFKLPENPEYASKCILPTDWTEVPLIGAKSCNHDSKIFTFGLPAGKSLKLPTCACLLVRGFGKGKNDAAIRPYTPISGQDMLGKFELLIKVYPNGVVSSYLDKLELGKTVGFKHIAKNIKEQYPFGRKTITMVAVGTGITPMYQALQLLARLDDSTKVTLLYGNKSPKDILLRDELDALAAKSGGRIKIVHVVSQKLDQGLVAGWNGELGWVDKAKFQKHGFPPSDDTLVMVCGLPGLYTVFCGPRDEKAVEKGTVLHQLGYSETNVAKF